MSKNLTDLQFKSIDELTIPPQFQAVTALTSYLVDNQFNENLINEAFRLINDSSIGYECIAHILNSLSLAFPKKCSLFSKLYKMMQEQKHFTTPGTYFENKNLDLLKTDIIRLVECDNLDDLIIEAEKESFDIDKVYSGFTLMDAACKLGAEKCFAYLKLRGSYISNNTSIYAIESGNKNIIMALFNDNHFVITDEHLTAALKYHHNDIFDWLLETRGSIGNLNIAQCFCYGNIKGLLFLIENGLDAENHLIFQKLLFIIIIRYSSKSFVCHYYKIFITIIMDSLII